MQAKLINSTIALAGILQAVSLVRDLAQSGKADAEYFAISIQSIFEINPVKPVDVFGDLKNLKLGLEKVIATLHPSSQSSHSLLIRYMLTTMRLQKKLSRSPALVKTLAQRIAQTQKQVNYFSLTHPTVIANLADIFLTILTPLRMRFYLVGDQNMLNIHENMDKIRALLLAALRASVLWRQTGGSRLQLLFSRRKIKEIALDLLKECP